MWRWRRKRQWLLAASSFSGGATTGCQWSEPTGGNHWLPYARGAVRGGNSILCANRAAAHEAQLCVKEWYSNEKPLRRKVGASADLQPEEAPRSASSGRIDYANRLAYRVAARSTSATGTRDRRALSPQLHFAPRSLGSLIGSSSPDLARRQIRERYNGLAREPNL